MATAGDQSRLLLLAWGPNLKLRRLLWMLSRKVRDAEVIGSGDPKRIARSAKNRTVGKALGEMTARLWR